MKIVINKSDNRLITFNGGDLSGNPEYLELEIKPCDLPMGDMNNMYYDPETGRLYETPSN